MSDKHEKQTYLRSVSHYDEKGQVTAISVIETDKPCFPTPAYDAVMKEKTIPKWLWKKVE